MTTKRAWMTCQRCGVVRYIKTDTKHPDACRRRSLADVPLTAKDILSGGRWVTVGGIKRWQPYKVAATMPTVVEHGTDSGYHTHRRQKHGWPKQACEPCRRAHAAAEARRTATTTRERGGMSSGDRLAVMQVQAQVLRHVAELLNAGALS